MAMISKITKFLATKSDHVVGIVLRLFYLYLIRNSMEIQEMKIQVMRRFMHTESS